MIHLRFILVPLFLIFSVYQAQALVITATGLPEEYRIFEWNSLAVDKEGEAVPTGYTGRNIDTYRFNIPDKFVSYDKDGSIELFKTLESWRTGTNRSAFEPRTDPSDGVRRFPFYTDYDPRYPRTLPDVGRFYGLTSALIDKQKYPNMRFSSSNGRHVSTKVPSLIGKLQSLKSSGRTISCGNNSGRAEECLICNCANESWVEPQEGRVNINQTVLRRVQLKAYPSTICDVIWQRSQFSWTFYSSRTKSFPRMSKKRINGNMLRQCADAAIETIKRGPWKYDSFYNPRLARPAWGWWPGISKPGHQHVYKQNPSFRNISLGSRQSVLNKELLGVSGAE